MALRKNHSILCTKFISSVYISHSWIGNTCTFRKLQVHLKRGTPKSSMFCKQSQEVDKFRLKRAMSRTFGLVL